MRFFFPVISLAFILGCSADVVAAVSNSLIEGGKQRAQVDSPIDNVVDTESNPFSIHDLEELLRGIIEGAALNEDINGHEIIHDVEQCIDGWEPIMDEIEQAVVDIEEGTKDSCEAGIHLLGEVLEDTSTKIIDCEPLGMDVFEDLLKMSEVFHHPWSFLWHVTENIIINHVNITNEIHDAMYNWNTHDYYGFGYNVGVALEQIVGDEAENENYYVGFEEGQDEEYPKDEEIQIIISEGAITL